MEAAELAEAEALVLHELLLEARSFPEIWAVAAANDNVEAADRIPAPDL
jgi:hypothetical protein